VTIAIGNATAPSEVAPAIAAAVAWVDAQFVNNQGDNCKRS
jgi:hypothetical protein